MSKDDGGPAFPIEDLKIHGHYGMSLRDYFATSALQGLLASYAGVDKFPETEAPLCHRAYKFADAMLAERAKHE